MKQQRCRGYTPTAAGLAVVARDWERRSGLAVPHTDRTNGTKPVDRHYRQRLSVARHAWLTTPATRVAHTHFVASATLSSTNGTSRLESGTLTATTGARHRWSSDRCAVAVIDLIYAPTHTFNYILFLWVRGRCINCYSLCVLFKDIDLTVQSMLKLSIQLCVINGYIWLRSCVMLTYPTGFSRYVLISWLRVYRNMCSRDLV